MVRKVGPWTVTTEALVYDNPWIRVTDHKVIHPGGADGQYGVISFRNLAIGVLAICDDGRIPLVGQHRFPLDTYSWELPEGGGPKGEAPIETARRELREETGYGARHWAPLIEADLSNSVTDEQAFGFLAWGLEAGHAAPEDSEELALRYVGFAQLLDACLSGEIRDSLTLLMVFSADQRARLGEFPDEIARLILER